MTAKEAEAADRPCAPMFAICGSTCHSHEANMTATRYASPKTSTSNAPPSSRLTPVFHLLLPAIWNPSLLGEPHMFNNRRYLAMDPQPLFAETMSPSYTRTTGPKYPGRVLCQDRLEGLATPGRHERYAYCKFGDVHAAGLAVSSSTQAQLRSA